MHPPLPAPTPTPWRARLAAAAGLCLCTAALAQPAPLPRPDPLDPQAAVPPARHDSVLQRVRGTAVEVKVADWKTANDTVTRIGGWRTYLREAARPDAPASDPAATAPPGPAQAPAPSPSPAAAPSPGGPHGAHRH